MPAQSLIEAVTESAYRIEEVMAPVLAASEKIAPEPIVVEEKVEPPMFGVPYLNNPAPN